MDNLPNELLPIIFKHLKIRDLIQCRQVCKRFLFFCEEVEIPEIIISKKIENIQDYWFHTNKQFNHKDAIDVRTFTTYISTFRLATFLKRLQFIGGYSDFDILNLNDLIQLEQLKIDLKIPNNCAAKIVHINLPNLKVLEVCEHGYDDDPREFYVTTPKLEILKCYEYDSIHLSDPNTIKQLELTFYTATSHALKNVEHLKFDWELAAYANILSIYPKLRTLVFHDFLGDEETIDTLYHIVEQKRALRLPELKIYFQSVELIDDAKIEEYEQAPSILDFQINNYNLLCDNISYDDPLEYNHLMRLVNDKIPDSFFKKIFNFQEICASGKVHNPDDFVRFLKNLKYLSRLDLEETLLDQNFYNGLHEFGQLTKLNVKKSSNSLINYDFLFKLKLLKKFTTDHNFPALMDMSFELFSRLKYFRYINFYFDQEFISISKNKNGNIDEYAFMRYKDTVDGPRQLLFESRKISLDHLVRLVDQYKTSDLV